MIALMAQWSDRPLEMTDASWATRLYNANLSIGWFCGDQTDLPALSEAQVADFFRTSDFGRVLLLRGKPVAILCLAALGAPADATQATALLVDFDIVPSGLQEEVVERVVAVALRAAIAKGRTRVIGTATFRPFARSRGAATDFFLNHSSVRYEEGLRNDAGQKQLQGNFDARVMLADLALKGR